MKNLIQNFLAFARRYPVVTGCIALLLFLGAANFLLWQRRQSLTRIHEEKRSRGEAMLVAIAEHSRLNAQLATVQEAVDFIDHNLATENDLAENLGYIYQLETICRIRLTQLNQLSSQPPAEGVPYRAIPVSLHATGTYAQLMHFIRELESGPRLLRIRSYRFTKSELANTSLGLDLNMEVLGKP